MDSVPVISFGKSANFSLTIGGSAYFLPLIETISSEPSAEALEPAEEAGAIEGVELAAAGVVGGVAPTIVGAAVIELLAAMFATAGFTFAAGAEEPSARLILFTDFVAGAFATPAEPVPVALLPEVFAVAGFPVAL